MVIVQKNVMVVMYYKWIGTVWFDWAHSIRFFVGYYYKMDFVVVVVGVVGCDGDVVVVVVVLVRSNR